MGCKQVPWIYFSLISQWQNVQCILPILSLGIWGWKSVSIDDYIVWSAHYKRIFSNLFFPTLLLLWIIAADYKVLLLVASSLVFSWLRLTNIGYVCLSHVEIRTKNIGLCFPYSTSKACSEVALREFHCFGLEAGEKSLNFLYKISRFAIFSKFKSSPQEKTLDALQPNTQVTNYGSITEVERYRMLVIYLFM